LPIAAEAEAASRAIAQLPTGATDARAEAPKVVHNLPAPAEPRGEVEPREEPAASLIPSIPNATRAAARWIRPLVPPFVARVIDTTTQPLRTARQVFEEVEEITISLRRTHKVTFDSESSEAGAPAPRQPTPTENPAENEFRAYHRLAGHERPSALPVPDGDQRSLAEGDGALELMGRDGPRELRAPDGPRQLPPGK
jgi:hypothetical protein